MKKDYTDITILLDRSGSMGRIKNDMVSGIESFIEAQRKLPGKCLLTLVQFDTTGYESVFTARDISDTPKIELQPRGCTPLLDSVARCINETGKRLRAMEPVARPGHVIFMIITDGEENASKEYSVNQIKQMITHQTDVYKWNFTYLGADQDAFEEAAKMGISLDSTLNYKANSIGTRSMYDSVNCATTMLRSGVSMKMAYNQSDIDKQNNA